MKNSKLADHTSPIISFSLTIIFLLLFTALVSPIYAVDVEAEVSSETSSLTIYNVLPDGSVVVVLQLDTEGKPLITISIEGQILNETILVLDEKGLPLHYTLTQKKLMVFTGNSNKTTIYYTTSGLVEVNGTIFALKIHSITQKSIIVLPENAGLVSFSDSPIVKFSDDRLMLEYNTPGTYKVEYVMLQTTMSNTGGEGEGVDSGILILACLILAPSITLSILFYYFYYSRRVKVTTTLETSVLDERDKMIIEELERSGELSLSELARRLKLAKSTIHRRVMKLKKLGIVSLSEGYGKTVLVRLVKKRER